MENEGFRCSDDQGPHLPREIATLMPGGTGRSCRVFPGTGRAGAPLTRALAVTGESREVCSEGGALGIADGRTRKGAEKCPPHLLGNMETSFRP